MSRQERSLHDQIDSVRANHEVLHAHVARGVYSVTLPAATIDAQDIEYYVEAVLENGQSLVFPATATDINSTVVVMKRPIRSDTQ